MDFKVTNDMTGVQFVVCIRADMTSDFTDNLKGLCSLCGAAVQHRPHVPPGVPLACIDCFAARSQETDTVVTTPRTMQELAFWARRN